MHDAFRIIPALPADHYTIQQIAHATWPDTFGDILSPEQITYMLDMMYSQEAIRQQVARGHVFLLLLEAQPGEASSVPGAQQTRYAPVGYASYEFNYLPHTCKLHKIYLLPDTQGKGYGRALMLRVANIARQAGQKTLRLDVNYQNKAVAFYEYLGFVKVGRFDTDIGNGYLMEDWQMELPL